MQCFLFLKRQAVLHDGQLVMSAKHETPSLHVYRGNVHDTAHKFRRDSKVLSVLSSFAPQAHRGNPIVLVQEDNTVVRLAHAQGLAADARSDALAWGCWVRLLTVPQAEDVDQGGYCVHSPLLDTKYNRFLSLVKDEEVKSFHSRSLLGCIGEFIFPGRGVITSPFERVGREGLVFQ